MSALLAPSLPLGHIELIDGREVHKPLPKFLHILIQRYLILALTKLLPSQYRAYPEFNTLTGGKTVEGRREYIVPDVVVAPRKAKVEDGDLAEPPLLGIEILSPGQTIAELFIRADRLLKLGCSTVWVIWPEKRKAWEYSADSLSEVQTQLTFRLPPGTEPDCLNLELSEMWAELDAE